MDPRARYVSKKLGNGGGGEGSPRRKTEAYREGLHEGGDSVSEVVETEPTSSQEWTVPRRGSSVKN